MQKIKVSTYFDITPTGIVRNFNQGKLPIKRNGFTINTEAEWYHRRRQQSNWETLFQIVMMRIQPETVTEPVLEEINGKKVWTFIFKNEIEDAFKDSLSSDPLAILKLDSNGVPMINGLEESEIVGTHLKVDENIFFELLND